MSSQTFECQSCGTPLTFPPGATSVVCPSCRTTNYAPLPSAPKAADGKREPASQEIVDTVNRQIKIQGLIAELDKTRDAYRNNFLPAKDQAGKQLDQEMIDFTERLQHAPLPDNFSSLYFGAGFFLLTGAFCIYQGGIFEDGVIGWIIRYRRIPNDVMMFGAIAWAVGVFFAVIGYFRSRNPEDPRPRILAGKKRELEASWQKWQDEDRKFNDKIQQLGDEIASLKNG